MNSWADIVYACGYSDQSHLVNEFRRFSGDTPGNISPRPSGPIGGVIGGCLIKEN